MNKISIKNFSEVEIEILNKLNKNGKGYIVGGAIRDILLGLKPKDVDFTTNLPYETLKDLFNISISTSLKLFIEILFIYYPFYIKRKSF